MKQTGFSSGGRWLRLMSTAGLALAACGAPQAAVPTEAAGDAPPTSAPAEAPTEAPPAESGTDISSPAPISESVSTIGWEITVLEVLRGDAALAKLKEASAFNGAPDDPALEWAVLRIRARRVGESSEEMRITKAFFSSAGSDGTEYKRPKITDVTNPDPELDAVLGPGGEAEGWITVFAPKDDPRVILVIQPYIYDGDTGLSTGAGDRRYISLGP